MRVFAIDSASLGLPNCQVSCISSRSNVAGAGKLPRPAKYFRVRSSKRSVLALSNEVTVVDSLAAKSIRSEGTEESNSFDEPEERSHSSASKFGTDHPRLYPTFSNLPATRIDSGRPPKRFTS